MDIESQVDTGVWEFYDDYEEETDLTVPVPAPHLIDPPITIPLTSDSSNTIGHTDTTFDTISDLDDISSTTSCSRRSSDNILHPSDSSSNLYMNGLKVESDLHIIQKIKVENAFASSGEYGLFKLFFSKKICKSIRSWTNVQLEANGDEVATENEINAVFGLELAMSICKLNAISDYWSEKTFLGQPDYSATMSRNRFQKLRSAIQVHPLDYTTERLRELDPLWHSRIMLEHFQRKFSKIAVPVGVSTLDEITIRTKARTRAKSYLPNKPDKYGIRMYAVVGWNSLYIHSFWDNSSGNLTNSNPADRYTKLFPELRTPLAVTLSKPDIYIDKKSAAALWIVMVGHQSKMLRSLNGHRLLVCDNFYTRHILARAIMKFTDNECRMLGTVRTNLIDKWNKKAVLEAIERVAKLARGSWELIAAVDVEDEWEKKETMHRRSQASLPVNDRTVYVPQTTHSPNAGYIVYMDKKIVVFYTNDLHVTPTKRNIPGIEKEAAICCHGTFPIGRWTGDEVLHKKIYMVPSIIAVYNTFMNGVDRVDQLRSTNPTQRKECRLSMTILTWLLDAAVCNAYALYKSMNKQESNKIKLREFKRRIAEAMTSMERKTRAKFLLKKQKNSVETIEEVVGNDMSHHMITPNSTASSNGKLTCYLCSIRGLNKKAKYGCTKCGRGFHVECFTALHYHDVLKEKSSTLKSALDAIVQNVSREPISKTRKRTNQSITPIEDLTLPPDNDGNRLSICSDMSLP